LPTRESARCRDGVRSRVFPAAFFPNAERDPCVDEPRRGGWDLKVADVYDVARQSPSSDEAAIGALS